MSHNHFTYDEDASRPWGTRKKGTIVSELHLQHQPQPNESGVTYAISLAPPEQSRLSVLFRIFLLIPHYVAIYLLFFVAEVIVVVAWFIALLLGRVPASFQFLLTGVLRYFANVSAYGALLDDRFPKFRVSPSVNSAIDLNVRHDPLNRFAVFFRIILSVPGYLLSALLGVGVGAFIIVMWFCALFTGRTPRALHQCVATILRYTTRFMAYVWLLTPDQPWHGWRGDALSNGEPSTEKTSYFAISSSAQNLVVVAIVLSVLYYVLTRAGKL